MTVLGVLRWGGMIRRFDGEKKNPHRSGGFSVVV
jgi:hypothetical protein